jgi:hypothetical protein
LFAVCRWTRSRIEPFGAIAYLQIGEREVHFLFPVG